MLDQIIFVLFVISTLVFIIAFISGVICFDIIFVRCRIRYDTRYLCQAIVDSPVPREFRKLKRKPLAKLIGLVFMISSTVAAVLIAQSLVPQENAPSRAELPDGSVRFVLQSMHESVSWPAGAAGLVISGLALRYLLRLIRLDDPEEKRRPHIVLCMLGYVLIAFIVFLFVEFLLLDPLFKFRSLVLTSDELSMSSLYRTWSMPLRDISNTHIDRNNTIRRGHECTDLCYEIRSVAGDLHRSITETFRHPSVEIAEYAAFLDSLDDELKDRLKKERVNPHVNADNQGRGP